MKKVAILQSNYIPWKGYFDMIAAVDEFVFYDQAQYTKNDWRNRNRIKTPQGVQWLTVPVVRGKLHKTILEAEIGRADWASTHWKTLLQNYRSAPHFDDIAAWLEPLYLGETHSHLSQMNRHFIKAICDVLGIKTTLSNAWDYTLVEGKTERLVELCVQAGAGNYVSGPSAMDYLDQSQFSERGIDVTWFDYDGYDEYPQLWGEFTHKVTILDLLFNCGAEAARYMRYVG